MPYLTFKLHHHRTNGYSVRMEQHSILADGCQALTGWLNEKTDHRAERLHRKATSFADSRANLISEVPIDRESAIEVDEHYVEMAEALADYQHEFGEDDEGDRPGTSYSTRSRPVELPEGYDWLEDPDDLMTREETVRRFLELSPQTRSVGHVARLRKLFRPGKAADKMGSEEVV